MFNQESMDRRYRQIKRATVARSVLDVIAMVFIGCALAFWFTAFWQLLAPPALLSLGTVSVAVLTLVYSLAAPLLLSMLVPTTPAGQLLQKTQWRTIGFPVIVMAALFLCWQGFTLIAAWLSAQGGIEPTSGLPVLQATGQVTPIAISLAIAFILIPALAWIQVSPEMWFQQIQQAHQVKKLEMQHRGELAIIKATLVRAEMLAAIGYANLLPAEKEELYGTLRGMLMGASDSMRAIVKTLGLSADLERSIMGDDEIADRLDYVRQAIDVVPEITPRAQIDAPVAPAAPAIADRAPSASGRANSAPAVRDAARTADRPGRSQTIPHDGEYTIAYEHYGTDQGWTVKQLAVVLGIEPETARKRWREWSDAGLITGRGQSNGSYRFLSLTESEAA